MVYNHALMFVPTLYFSLFANALYKVSWKRSFAVSVSCVNVTAKGFSDSAFVSNISLNSTEVAMILFNFLCDKVKQIISTLQSFLMKIRNRKPIIFCVIKIFIL